MNILLTTDSYKTSHHKMLPKGCTLMYGNLTPRNFKYLPNCKYAIAFGSQMTIRWLKEEFDKFFKDPNAVQEIKEILSAHLGIDYDVSHFQALHDLQYLPIVFKSLPEGSKVPVKVPIMTWYNTHPDFAWLPLLLETPISNMIWKPITTATISYMFRRNVDEWVNKTDRGNPIADYMIHDFSSRGMSSVQSSMTSGTAFLLNSNGTDNLPSLYGANKYYDTDVMAHSVFASEHSVSSACIGVMGEKEMINYYMEQYPEGVLSVVSDTLDLTTVVKPVEGGYLKDLKEKILNRDGKIVIRPDSNPPGLTPVDILCGHNNKLSERELEADYPEFYTKGLVQCLWDIFGGTINEQGYKVLDSHIGAIYGEAINLKRQVEIYTKLAEKGFAATNVILGIGSYTLNMNSRDTLGMAAKGTYCEIDRKPYPIYKDPITDDGTKKSAKGLLQVEVTTKPQSSSETLILHNEVSWGEEDKGLLREILRNGKLDNQETIFEIRKRIKSYE